MTTRTMHRISYIRSGVVLFLIATLGYYAVLSVHPFVARAESVIELRDKIVESQRQLEEIEKEIKHYEAQLNEVGSEKKTLQSAIRELDLSRKKIQSDVRATEHKIASTDLEIEELEREIYVKELEISRNMGAVAESFRTMDQLENNTLIEMVLGHESMAEVWDTLAEQTLLRDSLREDVRSLDALKIEYEQSKYRSLEKRGMLGSLKADLSGEQNALIASLDEKDKLLDKTKNKESNYQQMLADKKAAREQFEKEMAQYESQLKFILNPSTIPTAGSGALRWPFEPTFFLGCSNLSGALGNEHCITQYFGDTAFAAAGAYNGKGHNGIDFGVPTGTKITSALAGSVVGTGNTDAISGCYSYGKWALVKHGNGLTTLYAHLSSIAVSPGQEVSTGQLIGHSGNTGYSTGPHLHFSVYASTGVSIQRLGDFTGRQTGCSSAAIPVAGYGAYLNPINYL
jgi:murein DD-endopeptidase MepM/ murein hydrolase activator NlpD